MPEGEPACAAVVADRPAGPHHERNPGRAPRAGIRQPDTNPHVECLRNEGAQRNDVPGTAEQHELTADLPVAVPDRRHYCRREAAAVVWNLVLVRLLVAVQHPPGDLEIKP